MRSADLFVCLAIGIAAAGLSTSAAKTTNGKTIHITGEISTVTPVRDYPLDVESGSVITIDIHQKGPGKLSNVWARLQSLNGEGFRAFDVVSQTNLDRPWWQRLEYNVQPGNYILHVAGNGGGNEPLHYDISINEAILPPIPEQAKAMRTWITENGLGDILMLSGYYQFDELSYHQDFKSLFNYSPPKQTKHAFSAIMGVLDSHDPRYKRVEFTNRNRRPHIYVEFETRQGYYTFGAFQKNFEDQYRQRLKDKLVSVVAGFAHTSRLNVMVAIAGNLWGQWYISTTEGTGLDGMWKFDLTSAAASIAVPSSFVPIEKEFVAGTPEKHTESLSRFLNTYYSAKGGKVTVLENTARYLELIVRGLKGEVVKGGAQWERLSLAISVSSTGSDREEVRTITEGFLASGFGYPPDDSFTQSMEPAHTRDLHEYTKALLSRIVEFIKGQGVHD
jgi:hypothetical protein